MLNWFQQETIASNVLSRLDCVHALSMTARTNKELNRAVRENVWFWRHAVLRTCGTPLPVDNHTALKAWVCPWRSTPRKVPFRHDTLMYRFYDICDVRFEDHTTIVVAFLLRHVWDRHLMRMDATVSLTSLEVSYGQTEDLHGDAHEQYNANRGLAALNLQGRAMELDVPEEIICSCDGSLADIRCVPIHHSAIALYSGGDNTSDVYVFSNAGRLLRRIHVPRSVQEVMVSCKEGSMAILHFGYDTSAWLTVYTPAM